MPPAIRIRDKAGRARQLSLEEALALAARDLAAGENRQALLILEKAVRAAPFHARARYLLGSSQAHSGNPKDAAYNLTKAVDAEPHNAEYRAALALALWPAQPDEALPHLFAAIDLGSTDPNVFCNLTLLLLEQCRDQEVLQVSELGLAACREHFALLGNRGVALRHLGRHEESLLCCRRQLELQPDDARVWSNMGCILTELGRLEESEQAHAEACRLDPKNSQAHFNLAFTLLMRGNFHQGFREYEWRWDTAGLKREARTFTQPMWDGVPLAHRKILLHAEQGAGDTIQFARYLPLVAALGGQITFEVAPSLVRLMTFLPGSHSVIAAGSEPGDFAVHCPLLSLPLKLGTDLNSIPPPVPFIIPKHLKDNWRQRLTGPKPKVALVWAGNPTQRDDRTRSLPFPSLLPLINLASVDFFSLQVGVRAQDLKNAGLSGRIRDLSPFLTDFAETAAALSCMDLVISVDTSVAHLAGTLGRPLWLLTSFAPDWRWLRDRNDSPWYPSMRLFRQPTHGDWDSVINQVLGALQNLNTYCETPCHSHHLLHMAGANRAGPIRIKDKEGRSRQLSLEEALAEAARDLSNGDHTNALLILEKAVRSAPFHARARHLLGMSQANAGHLQDATYNLTKAVAADPQNVDYRSALAHALMVEKPSAAIPHFFAAIQLGATSVTVFGYLASILLDLGRTEEALQVCDQGLAICPEKAGMWGARAVVLRRLDRLDESLACSQRQLELQPDGVAAWCNLGVTLLAVGRVAESEEALRKSCALGPRNGEAHYNLALNLLLQGQYREGFREYEWRWQTAFVKGHAKFDQPLWDGSPLGNKRLFLHAEQGAGDTIQLARYLPLVAKLGGQIFLAVPPQLLRLFKFLDAPCEVIPPGLPPGIDTHCPLFSLPLLFGTRLDSIPPLPSFKIPSDLLELWARRVAGPKPKVGLVWAGSPRHLNDRNRSLPLRSFLPLLGIAEMDFFSLQLGAPAQDLSKEGVAQRVRDLSPFLSDYAETAAAISSLDLVISVDTSVAHLAASLGKPVWLLTPFAPDWRWLLGRQDSPWYPSMRLFRQKARGDWDAVINEVQSALPAWLPSTGRAPALLIPPTEAHHPADSGVARAKLAADFIPAGATVLDLGCGAMPLELFLPYGCAYIPCDHLKRDARTILCDFNKDSLPSATAATHLALLGQLEYIHDWRGFLKQLCTFKRPLVLSYHPTDYTPAIDRAAQGWVNHVSLEDLCAEIYDAGFLVQSSVRFENQICMRIQPGIRRAGGNPRVLVVTYHNTGNFGDRLGFHLINSVLPPAAEVHYATFDPWRIPPGDFDLLVLGAGNSMFERVLTDELISLVRRIPQSVGIFGTQYRQEINQARFNQLLNGLQVWFARSEEDILLYGKGRPNAIHLGDWLIDAFPLTRWTLNETLQIGQEIFGELPLDRTVQQIQQYRNVVSERLHPLLCALTSAERVAYTEQQDTGSGPSSGKFRGLLLDIFGRTWPESTLFEFRRECVADYKARVRAIVSGMPLLFEELLQIRRSHPE